MAQSHPVRWIMPTDSLKPACWIQYMWDLLWLAWVCITCSSHAGLVWDMRSMQYMVQPLQELCCTQHHLRLAREGATCSAGARPLGVGATCHEYLGQAGAGTMCSTGPGLAGADTMCSMHTRTCAWGWSSALCM